jgi:hypothetical protein
MAMECNEAQTAIRAAIDAETALDARTRVHLLTCDDCSEDYADGMLEHALAQEWVPPLREGFVDEVIAAAVHDGAAARVRRYAIAASIALFGVAIGLFFGYRLGMEQSPEFAHVNLVANEGKTVRLLIESPAAQDAAIVTIDLADNLELAGFPNEHRIEWQTPLAAGRNLLALPLTLTEPSDSQFRVGLAYGATHRDIRVLVVAQPVRSEA